MVIVQNILVSDEVLKSHFLCQLDSCKGACCWEGDFGAPLEAAEMETLDSIYPDLKPFLRPEGIKVIENEGLYTYYDRMKAYGTPLLSDGACVFLTFEENGIAKCGIEKAWEAGAVTFKKPISCHLYPIRVTRNEVIGFDALNYDRWDICSAACKAGKKAKLPLYIFVKDALVRKYGEEFYEELAAAGEWMGANKEGL